VPWASGHHPAERAPDTRGCLGSREHRRWFADPEHPQPGQEERPQSHEYERCGAPHTLKEHPTGDQHEHGRDAGDETKGGIRLTALRSWKEIAQPGHHRGTKRARPRLVTRMASMIPGSVGAHGITIHPVTASGTPTRIHGVRRPQRVL
jgi:hypothetical protein